jgi:hypothetical protein
MTETKTADNAQTEIARQRLQQDKEIADRSRQEYAERAKGKPTPTQEENDLAAHGAHILEHAADGSPPDPYMQEHEERMRKDSEMRKQVESKHAQPQSAQQQGGGYQTRQTTVEPHHTPTQQQRPGVTPTTRSGSPASREPSSHS